MEDTEKKRAKIVAVLDKISVTNTICLIVVTDIK